LRFPSSYLTIGRLFQLGHPYQAWRPVPVCDVSRGHLGNGLEPQQTEGRENFSCEKFVFYGSIFCREYIADFGTNYFRPAPVHLPSPSEDLSTIELLPAITTDTCSLEKAVH